MYLWTNLQTVDSDQINTRSSWNCKSITFFWVGSPSQNISTTIRPIRITPRLSNWVMKGASVTLWACMMNNERCVCHSVGLYDEQRKKRRKISAYFNIVPNFLRNCYEKERGTHYALPTGIRYGTWAVFDKHVLHADWPCRNARNK
jgi:hypothetical protein